jgi:hypothetical protein
MKKLGLIIMILFTMSVLMQAQSESLLCSAAPIKDKDGNKNAKTESTKSFEVTANPVNESVSVKFNLNANIESIKMIDNNSAIVFETGKSRGAAGSVLEIPVEDMEAGTYFVRVQTETGTQVQRIIISK